MLCARAVDIDIDASRTATAVGSVNANAKKSSSQTAVNVNDGDDEEEACCDRFLPCDPRQWMHRYFMLAFMCMLSFGSYYVYDNPTALQRTIQNVSGVIFLIGRESMRDEGREECGILYNTCALFYNYIYIYKYIYKWGEVV